MNLKYLKYFMFEHFRSFEKIKYKTTLNNQIYNDRNEYHYHFFILDICYNYNP